MARKTCFGTIKHHFVDTNWYVITTDLVNDKEVGVPGSALQFNSSLHPNDEVIIKYTTDDNISLTESDGTRCLVEVHELIPICQMAIGRVTETNTSFVIIDNCIKCEMKNLASGARVALDTILEFETVRVNSHILPYRCLWASVLDESRRKILFDLQAEQDLKFSNTKRHGSLRLTPLLVLKLVIAAEECREELPSITDSVFVTNMGTQPSPPVRDIIITKTILTGVSNFEVLSPRVCPEQGLVLEPNRKTPITIRASPSSPADTIYDQNLVIVFDEFYLFQNLRLVCGTKAFIDKYTMPYQDPGAKQTSAELKEKVRFTTLRFTKSMKLTMSEKGSGPSSLRESSKWFIPPEVIDLGLIESQKLVELMRSYFPYMHQPLDPDNYKKKLHLCIYLEELELYKHFQTRNIYGQRLQSHAEEGQRHFLIPIPNLTETRPSLIINDKVVCVLSEEREREETDPGSDTDSNAHWESSSTSTYTSRESGRYAQKPRYMAVGGYRDRESTKGKRKSAPHFQGIIRKLRTDSVIIQMEQNFKPSHKYDISFFYPRKSIIRQHEAIEMVAKSLRFKCLFPRPDMLPKTTPEPILDVGISSNGRLTIVRQPGEPKQWLPMFRDDLDASQQRVIKNILRGEYRALPYLIRGPPGTGKTTTLIEIMLQLMQNDPVSRILVCTQSNSAADLILSKLVETNTFTPNNIQRLVSATVYMHNSIPSHLVPFCATFLDDSENFNPLDRLPDKRRIKSGVCLADLAAYRILVMTTGLVPHLIEHGMVSTAFTHLIVDEAGQCLETDILGPLTLMEHHRGMVILTGDDRQLGPVLLSGLNSGTEFGVSLFERLMQLPMYKDGNELHHPCLSNQLNYNYRSVPTILNLFNDLFYKSQLRGVALEGAKFETLAMLQKVLPSHPLRQSTMGVMFYDTLGIQQRSNCCPSWVNPKEVKVILYIVQKIVRLGVNREDIGIITPYGGQKLFIMHQLAQRNMHLKVGSAEEFQGQEKPIILLSAVRSSEEDYSFSAATLGFVNSPKRLNVAISRAQSLLIIVGNSVVLGADRNWKRIIDYCTNRAAYVPTERELLEMLRKAELKSKAKK